MSPLEELVRDHILSYVSGRISAEELNDALPDEWDLDEADDPLARTLLARASGYLAGYHAGDRDEGDLRRQLIRTLTPATDLSYTIATGFTRSTGSSGYSAPDSTTRVGW